jgi:ribonuclease HI
MDFDSSNVSHVIFTDGACDNVSSKVGGYAGVILNLDKQETFEFVGRSRSTTSNRMEMMAAIRAVELVCQQSKDIRGVVICTDSQLLINGACVWKRGWENGKGINRFKKGKIKNIDLWIRLYLACDHNSFPIYFSYVPGHTGIAGNEYVDSMAEGILFRTILPDEYETELKQTLESLNNNFVIEAKVAFNKKRFIYTPGLDYESGDPQL